MFNSPIKVSPFRERNPLAALVLLGLATTILPVAADTTWTGAASDNQFATAGNWDNGVPAPANNGFINSAGSLSISLSSDTTVGSLTTSGTGSVALSIATANLTLNGGLTLADAVGSTGIVNLTGGSIKVGGTNGILAGSGTALLNLGGGTLQVNGSNLTSNVPLALSSSTPVTGSYSVIDSNGLGANFSGEITAGTAGAGLLIADTSVGKTGTVTFSGTGNRYIASLGATGSAITQSAGATTTAELAIGTGTGSVASFTLSGGSLNADQFAAPFSNTAATFRIGDFGGTGIFNQSGGTVNVGSATVGGSLNIGNQNGHGTYNLSGGTLNLMQGLSTLGRTSGGVGNGGSTGALNISGTGALNIQDTANLVLSNWYPTADGIVQGTGVLTQTGGTVTVANTATLTLTGKGTGTYNLNGGTLKIGGSSLVGIFGGQSGTYTFNLGGGTLQVTGANLTTDVNLTLSSPHPTSYAFPSSYSILDSNGYTATLSGGIVAGTAGAGLVIADSSIAKTGNVTFTGTTDRYIASLLVVGGGASQSNGTTHLTEIAVGTGSGSTASYTLSGGTMNANLLDAPFTGSSPAAAASFRIGDYGGTGTFTQTGGTVNIGTQGGIAASLNIGNQGGHGTYNLSGGSLNLQEGISTLGRTANGIGNGGSTGELNLSGTGSISLNGASQFVLSNWYPAAGGITQGTGVLTQTGGTITVANTALFMLTGNGTGTYNLNGGTLKIGGSSLVGVFGGESGTYNFNLGGGTIQVKDSSLVTSVHATLTGESNSTIDTNGFNATFSGVIDGTGSLTKAGTGILTLSAANTYSGATYVSQGILKLGINDALSATSALYLEGTTLNLAGFSTLALVSGLTLTSDSVIDFGSGHASALSLVFGDSSDLWEGGLTLLNFDVLTDKLGFTSAEGLTTGQLASIHLSGYDVTGLDEEGFVQFQVVPEPSSIALLGVSSLALLWAMNKRRRA